MKFLVWISGILASLVIAVYVIAFTGVGNSILKPIVENKINQQTKLQSKLTVFSLSMSDFEIILELNQDNVIHVKGNYSLFSQAFDIVYKVKLNDLKALRSLVNAPLQGVLYTDGTVVGDSENMKISGKSDIGESQTTYNIDLIDFQPKKVIATIKDAKISKLLYMVSQPNFASSNLNADIKLTSLDLKNLAGSADIILSDGLINSAVMKKIYKVNIPKTRFTSKTHLDLKGKRVDYNMWFKSNLASLGSSGNILPASMDMDLIYGLNIKELAMLKPITGADIRGNLNLKGKVKGDKKKLIVKGKSNVALSDTNFEAVLKDFSPASIKANIKNMQLKKVLYMVKQPSYASGLFSMNANITDARSGKLKGNIVTNIKKGLLNSKQIVKEFKFKSSMPHSSFVMATVSKLDGNLVNTKIDFDSSLLNLDVKKARFDINDASVKSDYLVKIPNLDKLFFASQRHLKGGITLNGEFKKDKDMDLSVHSKVAGGVIDAKLHNDDFIANLKSLQTLDALHMLIYPEIFKSTLDGKLDYNLAKEKGKFSADLTDGVFTQNQMFTLIKQFAKVNLYKENFKGDVSADIHKEKIVASMNLKSNTSSIATKNSRLNSKTKVVDSTITVVANKTPITVSLTGKTTSPKVSVDVQKLMKSKVGKKVEKEVLRFFKKLF